MIELTDKGIQNLIDARAILNEIKKDVTGAREAITFIDIFLNDIYEGWIEHINEE